MRRRADVDPADVVEERLGVGGGDLFRRLLLESRRDEHLVLAAVERVVGEMADVGDVHDLLAAVAEVVEAAAKKVWQHERPQIADVGEAIDRGTARVDAHDAVIERPKVFLSPRERVVEAHRGRVHSLSMLAFR